MTAAELAEIEALARDLPTLWEASQTSFEEKRQIVHRLVQRVVVWAPVSSDEVRVQLHWAYGTVTEHRVARTVRTWKQMAGATDMWNRVQEWQTAGWTSSRIAEELNREGHRTPHGRTFTAGSVRKLIERGGPQTAAEPAKAKRKRKQN